MTALTAVEQQTLPLVVAVNDYGPHDLANAEVANGIDNAAGTAVPIKLVSTNAVFDINAQAVYIYDQIKDMLDGREPFRPEGTLFIGTTDQRNDEADVERFKNQGAEFLTVHFPSINATVLMANAGNCWAPLARLAQQQHVGVHKVEIETETQFRGARLAPQLGIDITKAIARNSEAVRFDRNLTSIAFADDNAVTSLVDLNALARGADEILRAPHRGVTEFVAPHAAETKTHALLISDYVRIAKAVGEAARLLQADVVTADIATNDFIDAGFIAAQTSLNANTRSLYVIDAASLHQDLSVDVRAAQLPNGSLIVGPNHAGVWENLADAGLKVHTVPAAIVDGRDIVSVAGSLWQGHGLDAVLSTPPVRISPPLENVIQHADPFGQGKFRPTARLAQWLARSAANPSQRSYLQTVVGGNKDVARATSGIFGLVSGELGVAQGSSGWTTLDGRRVVFLETVVRDGSSMRRLGQPLDALTGRARSGQEIQAVPVADQFDTPLPGHTVEAYAPAPNTGQRLG